MRTSTPVGARPPQSAETESKVTRSSCAPVLVVGVDGVCESGDGVRGDHCAVGEDKGNGMGWGG